MINLLPPQGKKKVSFEYHLRVASAYLMLIGSIVIVVGVLFLPSFFLIVFQKSAYMSQLDSSVDTTRLEDIEKEFKISNDISDLLLDTKRYIPTGSVIDVVWELAAEGVVIINLQIVKKEGAISAVNMRGVAINRDVLIQFRDSLKEHEYFEEVNLPISDLTKNENINFSIAVTPTKVLTEFVPYEN